jgi:hypothetical protein
MKKIVKQLCAAAFLSAFFAPVASAQDIDPELFMKWAAAEVVHYDVVAEYSGVTVTLTGGKGAWRSWNQSAVKDRFEISFDWNPAKLTLVGTPVYRNSPSNASKVFEGACQQPVFDGPYEHLEIVGVTFSLPGELHLSAKRMFPAGAQPNLGDNGRCGLEAVAAKTEMVTHSVPIIPGTALVMPHLAPKHVRIGEKVSETNTVAIGTDQKTIVVDDTATNGWKYTYTLRIVK